MDTSSSNEDTPSRERKPWFAATLSPGLRPKVSQQLLKPTLIERAHHGPRYEPGAGGWNACL